MVDVMDASGVEQQEIGSSGQEDALFFVFC